MMKTRVLFIVPTLGEGGTERAVSILIQKLNNTKFLASPALFTLKGEYLPDLPEGTVVHDLQKNSRWDNPRALRRLVTIIRKERPDILYSLGWYSNLVAILAHKVAGTPARLILGVRNFPSRDLDRLSFSWLHRMVVRFLYQRADLILSNSQASLEDLVKNFSIPRESVAVIYNAIDTRSIRELALEPFEGQWSKIGKPIIVAAGRLTKQKGHESLVRAVARVRQTVPCRLGILGVGPLQKKLEALGRDLGFGEDLIFPGFQINPYKFMKRATVFVLSSLWEGFPNVLVEAMACGTPVVAMRCPSGPEEIIDHGENGLLTEVADEEDLARKILELLEAPALRGQLSEAGLSRAADFSVERIVPQLEEVFLSLVDKKPK